jgi:hypothetical protein
MKFAGALAAATFMLVPVTADAGVVVSASGPSAGSYPVGRKIGDDERIVLRAGDILTVLDGKGTRVLRGTGTYTLSQQPGASQSGAFAVLTRQRSATRMRTGAVRNAEVDMPITRPNLWYVDVAAKGPMCLPSASGVRLWRSTSEEFASYTVASADGGSSASVVFGEGDMLSAWHEDALPVTDGSNFTISGPQGAAVAVSFKVIGDVPDDPEALAEKLIENGCDGQLELLSSTLMLPES